MGTACPYPVVDTGQATCYDANAAVVGCNSSTYPGEDGFYTRNPPSYTDNGDGSVLDNVTGLVWQRSLAAKMPYADAAGYCDSLVLAGASDWRLPTLKQLYSLIQFTGFTGSMQDLYTVPADAVPYLDTSVFDFQYGNTTPGDRFIDAQEVSATNYVSKTFADNGGTYSGNATFFGVNFADGRIKGYPQTGGRSWFVRCVRGAASYGANDFVDRGDRTILDQATGLTWMQDDSGVHHAGDRGDGTMDWQHALSWCQDLDLAGHTDWKLPNAKELQSLVDYTRSRDTTGSAAIDPLFVATSIVDEAGDTNFAFYWTSTTHLDGRTPGSDAVYVAFGEALGFTTAAGATQAAFLDVHGAGAQRGDPKTGLRSAFPQWGTGPQGDVRRVFNMVRCVRSDEPGSTAR